MNTKLKKSLNYLAAGLFVCVLLLNVKMSLDAPFPYIYEEALASETTQPILFDKIDEDCTVTIEGDIGQTGTWMGISFTVGGTGSITLTCGDCKIYCPIGTKYLREDCTTRDCGTASWDPL